MEPAPKEIKDAESQVRLLVLPLALRVAVPHVHASCTTRPIPSDCILPHTVDFDTGSRPGLHSLEAQAAKATFPNYLLTFSTDGHPKTHGPIAKLTPITIQIRTPMAARHERHHSRVSTYAKAPGPAG